MLDPSFVRPTERRAAHSLRGAVFRVLMLFLLSRARIGGELSPFAPACFASALARGCSPLGMLAGCAAGCLSFGYSPADMIPLLCCGAVCLLYLLCRCFPALAAHRNPTAAFCAGAGTLAVSLSLSGALPYNILLSLLSAAAAALLAPALDSALGIRLSRTRLMHTEQISLALLLIMLLGGVRALPFAGEFAALTLACFCTLFCSAAGSGTGAMCGILTGTALSLSGPHPFIGASLSLCGVLAGCAKHLPRPCAAAIFLAGSLLHSGQGIGGNLGALDPIAAAAGALLYCLFPTGALLRLRSWLQPPPDHPDPEQLSIRLRRETAQRLEHLSAVFGSLADGFAAQQTLPSERQLLARVRETLCGGCEHFGECWQADRSRSGRLLCRIIVQHMRSGSAVCEQLPRELADRCQRAAQMDGRLSPLLRSFERERRGILKRGESRALLAALFRSAQNSLDELALQMHSAFCLHREYAALAHAVLERCALPVQEVCALLDNRIEFICMLRGALWDERKAHAAAQMLSRELGIPFSPVVSQGRVPEECELRLLQAPALYAAAAAASVPAQPDAPCGDSHIAQLLPDGRMLAAISDGMGHGSRAAAESRRCISLLRKFVCAGIDRDTTLTSVNRMLLLQCDEEMFATVDLCVVNLYSGIASFSKSGAGRSFILQEDGITQVSGGQLPLGILERVEPVTFSAEVFPEDIILMISDGIADELKEGQTEALLEFIAPLRSLAPSEIARRVIEWAKNRAGEKDDMTVIAIRILSRSV